MNQRTAAYLSLAMSAALGLSSCAVAGERAGTDGLAASADPASSAASPTRETSQAASTAAATASATAGAQATATPAPDPAPALADFTFPDGHLSFSYPADWSVRLVDGPAGGTRAVIADAGGNELASVTTGTNASDATGPVVRTVLDAAPVANLRDAAGGQLSFGFAFDSFADHVGYHMGIRREADFDPSTESAGYAHVELPDGDAVAKVIFGDPAFGSVDAAKAWMATEQYSQLKAMLLSLSYN